jgi:hypothetical protein
MEAREFWEIYPQADRAKVEDLIRRLAEDLGMDEAPEVLETTIPLPANRVEVVASLDMIEPGWQGEGLIKPPVVPVNWEDRPVHESSVHESGWSSWGKPVTFLVLGIVGFVVVMLVALLLVVLIF